MYEDLQRLSNLIYHSRELLHAALSVLIVAGFHADEIRAAFLPANLEIQFRVVPSSSTKDVRRRDFEFQFLLTCGR